MVRRGHWYRFTVAAFAAFAACMGVWAIKGLTLTGGKALPIVTAVFGLSGTASLFFTWKAARTAHLERVSGKDIRDAADRLAAGLAEERKRTERIFRLNDPYPLSVPWVVARNGLADALEDQRRVAESSPGFTEAAAADWITNADEFSGSNNDLTKIFERCPARRIVVLGEPGAGKTILLSRLQWDLLEKRESGGMVPVMFPLAEWLPGRQDLQSWMAERLMREHPFTAYPHMGEEGDYSKAHVLIREKLILPILDGFDEVPNRSGYSVLNAINRSLSMGQSVILSSRTENYRLALAAGEGAGLRLTGAAAVEVQPVPASEARAYLLRDAGGSGTQAAERWGPVVQQLGSDTPVGRALRTPLMLFLCRSVYNARIGTGSPFVPSPEEICERTYFPSDAAVKNHLARAYIPAVYSNGMTNESSFGLTPEKALRAHRALARYMAVTLDGATEIKWWEFHRVSRRAAVLASFMSGVLGFLLFFVPLACRGESGGVSLPSLFFALIVASFVHIGLRASRRVLTDGVRWGVKLFTVLAGAFAGCMALTLRGVMRGDVDRMGSTYDSGLVDPFSVLISSEGLGWAICGALVFALAFGWTPRNMDSAQPVSPLRSLQVDRRTFLKAFFIWASSSAIVVVAFIGICFPRVSNPSGKAVILMMVMTVGMGLFIGSVVGFLFAFRYTAWGIFLIARPVRAVLTGMPLRLMTFLEHAYELGVLRKVGSAYQFRHAEIRRSLLVEARR
ncbi:NACHT domain-containing protein [Streptomyces rimosus]|uniref:NACHT domain-containing protein n=1 Tax=Streptomyces rimosus TaxID=1927 RepID=UPI0031CF56CA